MQSLTLTNFTNTKIWDLAVEHQQQHHCGAKPYENLPKLLESLRKYQPTQILEIGTGIGYTAIAMSRTLPEAQITTLEKDPAHAELANQLIAQMGLGQNVNVLEQKAEEYFTTTQNQFDFILFDGFQIHYEFLQYYESHLRGNGILFLANNHLTSKTSDRFFKELFNNKKWLILEQFADTTIVRKIILPNNKLLDNLYK